MNHVDHIEHIEDLPILDGYAGALRACDYLQTAGELILGKEPKRLDEVSIKYDGSFSFIAGWDPRDNKFFVAKKSIFNKEPVYYKSDKSLSKSGLSDDLYKCFSFLLKYLPEVINRGIFQGDFMFTPEDLKYRYIGGNKLLSFRANTLVYAIPEGLESFWEGKIGVALHTNYDGHPGNLRMIGFNDNYLDHSESLFNFPRKLSYNPYGPFSLLAVSKTRENVRKYGSDLDAFFQNREFRTLYKRWLNWSYKENQKVHFGDWLENYFLEEREKRKTLKGKEAVNKRYDEMMFLTECKALHAIQICVINPIIGMKHKIIDHFNRRSPYYVFYETIEEKLIRTKHEGFVINDQYGLNPKKLVNRMEFSRINQCNDVIRAWDR